MRNYYIISGSSKGIGYAITMQILEKGNSKVIGISRSNSIVHPDFTHIPVDLSDIDKLQNNLNSIFPSFDKPSKIVLINNAGILGQVGHVGNLSNDKIREVFNVNTIAPAILMNEFIKRYLNCTDCQKLIINVSSGAGKRPVDGWSGYCASKSALDMYSNVIGVEKRMDHNNIRIFSVSPGIVDTAMQDEIRQVNKEDFSRLAEFIEYKKEGMLVPAKKVAMKYMHIIENVNEFPEVIVSVRDF